MKTPFVFCCVAAVLAAGAHSTAASSSTPYADAAYYALREGGGSGSCRAGDADCRPRTDGARGATVTTSTSFKLMDGTPIGDSGNVSFDGPKSDVWTAMKTGFFGWISNWSYDTAKTAISDFFANTATEAVLTEEVGF